MERSKVVVGVDGGGTHCRTICADLHGNVLSYVEGGGTNPEHNSQACETARGLIGDVIAKAGRCPQDVEFLVAGLSGLDHPKDLKWAEEFTSLPGLSCAKELLNDAQIAHAGALRGLPGIVGVIGTGAMIWAITEAGENHRDYDFGYYSWAASRFFSLMSVHAMLSEDLEPADRRLEEAALREMGVSTKDELRALASTYVKGNSEELKRSYGRLARTVTAEALIGAPLASRICEELAGRIVKAFVLLAGCFQSRPVKVSVVGGVGRCEFMKKRLPEIAESIYQGRLSFVEPDLSPLAGAALLGLEKLGRDGSEVANNLRKHPAGCFSE